MLIILVDVFSMCVVVVPLEAVTIFKASGRQHLLLNHEITLCCCRVLEHLFWEMRHFQAPWCGENPHADIETDGISLSFLYCGCFYLSYIFTTAQFYIECKYDTFFEIPS